MAFLGRTDEQSVKLLVKFLNGFKSPLNTVSFFRSKN